MSLSSTHFKQRLNMNKLIIVLTIIGLLCLLMGALFFKEGCEDFLVDECLGFILRVNVTSIVILINLCIVSLKIYVTYIKNSKQRLYLKIIQMSLLILLTILFSYCVMIILFVFA